MKTRFAALCVLTASGLYAQSTPLKFEVASIKPAAPDSQGTFIQFQPPNGLRVTNMPVRFLIRFAYDVQDFQISAGPGWIKSDRYDIQAKAENAADSQTVPDDPRKLTDDQRKTMNEQMRERMRTLLSDRFQLQIHKETKEAPVYALVVAKGGPKLKENPGTAGGRQGIGMRPGGQANGTAAPLALLANLLSNVLSRPVIDRTGLTGKYDFELKWTPDAGQEIGPPGGLPPGVVPPPPPDPNGPTIFTALQEQLGLRLESAKGPMEMIVVDRVEKPSEN